MASFKEDERQDRFDVVGMALQGMARDIEDGSGDPTKLRNNGADIAALPPLLLGQPIHFIRVPLNTQEEDDDLIDE